MVCRDGRRCKKQSDDASVFPDCSLATPAVPGACLNHRDVNGYWQGAHPGQIRPASMAFSEPHTRRHMSTPFAPRDPELFEQGLKTRREVLGSAYVDASIQNANEFNIELQHLVTQYCWGDVWNRPGLDRKTRSLLNLAMITALNRPH